MKGSGFDPWSGESPCAMEQLSLCANHGAHALELVLHKRAALTHGNQRKPLCSNKDSAHPKINIHKIQNHLLKKRKKPGTECSACLNKGLVKAVGGGVAVG